MQKLSFYIQNPRLFKLALLKKFRWLFSDKQFLKIRYHLETGARLDHTNPKRFTEKIQWLKIYNRQPEYSILVDKYAVKEYVERILGEQYVIPTLGVWDSPDDIDFEELPNQFVLKTTHGGGSGGVVICRDKATLDYNKLKSKLQSSLKADIYAEFKEWPYKNVPRRIIAEPLLVDHTSPNDLTDYKFFCFNGIPSYCQVIKDRSTCETIDFFDKEWNHMPFYGLNPKAKQASKDLPKPINFDNMLNVASKLSAGFPFLRVDLYNINGKIYFGEITFFPASGFGKFSPDEWDERLGKLIDLSSLKA